MADRACGGIDLGGTKIEARLFDTVGAQVAVQRIATPKAGFDALLAALLSQIDWLTEASGAPDLPIGIALPGIIDPDTGLILAANIPVGGHDLSRALRMARSRTFPLLNDAMAFTLSEASPGGAAHGARNVVGFVLGTGVGAGQSLDGAPPPRHAGLSVEVGHIGMPAAALARHELPIWTCGCGRDGCTELYVSGTGLTRLAHHLTGRLLPADMLVTRPEGEGVLDVWADLMGETLAMLQLLLAPNCIVFGGGLSNLPDLLPRLIDAMTRRRLGQTPLPRLALAAHGDASGARGAALYARHGLC